MNHLRQFAYQRKDYLKADRPNLKYLDARAATNPSLHLDFNLDSGCETGDPDDDSIEKAESPELNMVLEPDPSLWKLLDLIQCQKHYPCKMISPL